MSETMQAAHKPIARAALAPDQCARWGSLVLVAMPALFAMATYQPFPNSGLTARTFSLPVVAAEGIVAWLALRSGFDPITAWKRLALHTQVAAATWLVAVLVAAMFAWRDPVSSWIWAGVTLMHALFAFAIYDRFSKNWSAHRDRYLDALCIGLAGYVLIAVLLSLTLWHTPDYPWVFFGIGVSNVRQICFYGLPLIAIAAGRLSAEAGTEPRFWQGIFLATGLFAVLWSGGRANVLAAGVALLLALILAKRAGRIRIAKFSSVATLAAAPLSIMLAPHSAFGASNVIRFVPADSASLDQYSSARWEFWKLTLREIVDQPFLGHAQGSFPSLLSEHFGVFYNHPHNFMVQFPYELGLPGAIALLALVAGALKGWPALYRSKPTLAVITASGLSGLTVNASLEGAFFHPLPVLCAILFTTISASARQLESPGSKP